MIKMRKQAVGHPELPGVSTRRVDVSCSIIGNHDAQYHVTPRLSLHLSEEREEPASDATSPLCLHRGEGLCPRPHMQVNHLTWKDISIWGHPYCCDSVERNWTKQKQESVTSESPLVCMHV